MHKSTFKLLYLRRILHLPVPTYCQRYGDMQQSTSEHRALINECRTEAEPRGGGGASPKAEGGGATFFLEVVAVRGDLGVDRFLLLLLFLGVLCNSLLVRGTYGVSVDILSYLFQSTSAIACICSLPPSCSLGKVNQYHPYSISEMVFN